MKIVSDWLNSDASIAVTTLLERAGHQALFVGGCVRNALLNAPVSDLDLSTDARPERVMELAHQAGIKAVPTGIDHGTITLITHGTPIEITTFRKDVATDGRRAVVAFTDQVGEDAARRDFTMNALYCDRHGTLIDPLGGLPDLEARQVRFILDPIQRVREDYLRILRFFRFHAWYGRGGIDAEGLAACAALSDGLETIAKERIGQEMLKLLAAPDPAPALASMQSAGVLMRCLPGADAGAMAILVHFEAGLPANPLRRLTLLGGENPAENLRLSKADARQISTLTRALGSNMQAGELGYRLGLQPAQDVLLLRAAFGGQAPEADIAAAQHGAEQTFPVSAKDFAAQHQGPALGAALKAAEARWIASGFSASKEDLIAAQRG